MWNSDETKSESEEGREQEGKGRGQENEVKGRMGERRRIQIEKDRDPNEFVSRQMD